MPDEEQQREATPPPSPAEAAAAEPAEGGKKTLAERAAAPAGPPTAVLAPRPEVGDPVVSRRRVLQVGFWASLGGLVAGLGAVLVDNIYPRGVAGFGGTVDAGDVSQYPPGTKTEVPAGRFWLVNLTEDQGGPGMLALWRKCPHLGCTVPWRPTFVFPDPQTGAPKAGWFRCPCHGSTYTDAGVRVFGPAPRSMDTMALSISGGKITVDTGNITPGGPNNAERAVRT
jgi:cytochrome b6-f complex iron-sulfur subunit